jgi:NTP pyrophosphatase (non-canonical NTP hydrolase)
MKNVQKEVDDWVAQYKLGYFKPLEIIARLAEETGELAREINHRYGPKKKKSTEDSREVEDEIGDIIFTLACLANSLGLDMERGFSNTMGKYVDRDKDRWEKK